MASPSQLFPIGVVEADFKDPGVAGAPKSPAVVPAFTQLTDLANEKYGGEALWSSDDFFAAVDNLVKRKPAEFVPLLMTERGKQMDGWESRRHNKLGVDTALVKLGLRGIVHGVCVDTSHFSGNHSPEIQVEVTLVPEATNLDVLLDDAQTKWTTIVPRSRCRGSFHNYFAVTSTAIGAVSHVRLRMFPDGGIARLRVYGEVKPAFTKDDSLDLAIVDNGGLVVAASDSHFSAKDNIIGRGFGLSMIDGWETRRSRTLDHSEWLAIRLGHKGWLKFIEVDTRHFKGNPPQSFKFEGLNDAALAAESDPEKLAKVDWAGQPWQLIVDKQPLHAHRRHFYHQDKIVAAGPWTHVRITIFPDGGVSRLRVFGYLQDPSGPKQ